MIKSLKIQNFQSHEKTKLSFSKGVNVIIGPSDAGKSTIIRVLRWIVWNRPSGDSIRSHWRGKTYCELETNEGDIVRSKDKTDSYQIYRAGEALDFKAFGTAIPEEVNKILNINEINLQEQLDTPFLLSNSPGEVAQHFNKIARLDKIDTGTQNVNKWIRELIQDINYKNGEIVKFTVDLGQFDHLEKFEAEVEVLEGMENQLQGKNRSLINLRETIFRYNQCSRNIESYQKVLSAEKQINNLIKLYKLKEEKIQQRIQLETLLENILYTDKVIRTYQRVTRKEQTVNNLLDLYDTKNTMLYNRNELFNILSELRNIRTSILRGEQLVIRLEKRFDEEMPNICPLCGTKLK